MGCQFSRDGYKEGDCMTDAEAMRELTKALRDLFKQHLPPLQCPRLTQVVDSLEDGIHGLACRRVANFPEDILCISLSTILGLTNCPVQQIDQRQRLFLEACQRRKCDHAALCAAVLTRGLHKVEHIIPLIDLNKAQDVLLFCVGFSTPFKSIGSGSGDSLCVWSLVLDVLEQRPEWGSLELAHRAFVNFYTHPNRLLLRLLALMLRIDSHIACLVKSMIPTVEDLQDVELFAYIIDIIEENKDIFETEQDTWLDIIISFLSFKRDDQNKSDVSFRRKEAEFIERGLSITSPQPEKNPETFEGLMAAAFSGWTDLVKIYYSSGCVNPVQLFNVMLMKNRLLQMGDVNEEKSARQIQLDRYICAATATPRRLQDLCAFTVSASLGHRSSADRAAKAQRLELPIHLKDKVLFKDIIEEFIHDTIER